MKACAITDKQPSMCEVFLISKTNWGFFSMFTQKRRGRLDRERTNIFKIDRSSSTTALKWFLIATALMEWSTFLGCFFTLKKGSGNKGYGANTSVRHPASNNALNPQLLFSECEVGVQTAQTWKLWWFVSYWINTLKLLLSTKPNHILFPDMPKSYSSDHMWHIPSLQLHFQKAHASHGHTCWFSICGPHRDQ